jgi:hypothetical protein
MQLAVFVITIKDIIGLTIAGLLVVGVLSLLLITWVKQLWKKFKRK